MFQAHGDFDIQLRGNILFVKAWGAMNAEAESLVYDTVLDAIAPLKGRPWAFLIDSTEWELGTPEFAQKLSEHMETFVKKGLKRGAHVTGSGCAKRIQIESIKADPSLHERRFFISVEEAIAWLSSEGFQL